MARSSSRTFTRTAALLVIVAATAVTPTHAADRAASRATTRAAALRRSIADSNRPTSSLHVRTKAGKPTVDDRGLDPRPQRAFAAAFPKSSSVLDPANIARAELDLLRSQTSTPVFGAREQLSPLVATMDPDAEQTDRFLVGSGDLTGDGLADGLGIDLTYHVNQEAFEVLDISINAIRGTDGASVWTNSVGSSLDELFDTFVEATPDINGDGSADVLVIQFVLDTDTGRAACELVGCAAEETASYHYVLRAISGATGDDLWTKTYNGSAVAGEAFGGAFVAFGLAYAAEATNVGLSVAVSGDHNGDHGADVVVNAFGLTISDSIAAAGAFVAGAFAFDQRYLVATDAAVLGGADGSTLFTKSAPPQPGFAVLLPAGNTVGDATADLLWEAPRQITTPLACVFASIEACASPSADILSAEMIDGATLATAWSQTTVGGGYVQTRLGDLNADGHDDVLAYAYPATGPTLSMISGADGSSAWTRTADGSDAFAVALGSIGGAPGVDLLILQSLFGETFHLDMLRVDGATGEKLLRTSLPRDPLGNAELFLYSAGDTDGDGVLDIATEIYSFDDNWDFIGQTFSIESGATGDILFEDHDAYYAPVGDLNGDGTNDLLGFDIEPHRSSVVIRVRALSMPTGALAWENAERFLPELYLQIVDAGDIDGVPGADLLQSRAQFIGFAEESRYEGIAGSDGTRTWTHGDAFTPPAALGTSTIRGTVTDAAGNPVPDICVQPYDATGAGLEPSYTAADGTYAALELSAGTYKIKFRDCGPGTFYSQWYAGALTFEAATPLTIADGETLSGIDAALVNLPGPVNDNMADALDLTLPATDERTTIGATLEAGEPQACGFSSTTVWYRFTAPADGIVSANTFGSSFDTILSAYVGDPSSGSQVACNDDFDGWQSKIDFDVVEGQTYYLQAGGYEDQAGRLELTVTI